MTFSNQMMKQIRKYFDSMVSEEDKTTITVDQLEEIMISLGLSNNREEFRLQLKLVEIEYAENDIFDFDQFLELLKISSAKGSCSKLRKPNFLTDKNILGQRSEKSPELKELDLKLPLLEIAENGDGTDFFSTLRSKPAKQPMSTVQSPKSTH
jgi:hypothetical protein